jgi:hypothetical protein
MGAAKQARIAENVRVFKLVNNKQRKQYMADRFNHIKDCVNSYNKDLLPGEVEIDIREMGEQIGGKC